MAGKRKMSTRLRDAEAAAAKEEEQPSPEKDDTDEEHIKDLPTEVVAGQPLPTLKKPQPASLSPGEYQSIAESGMLAASLKRSKDAWLFESIFELYSSKSSKRKAVTDSQSTSKEKSTVKLGPCTMTVGPHIFHLVLYGVKAPQAHPGPSPLPQPAPKQTIPPRQSGENLFQKLPPIRPPPTQSMPAASQWPATSGTHPSTRPLSPKIPLSRLAPQQQPPPVANRTLQPNLQQRHALPSHSSLPAPEPRPDPIIEMLAAKAATDLALKELMKTVAAGFANADELRIFQEHIDGLRKMAQSRRSQYEASSSRTEPISRPVPGPTLPPMNSSGPPPQHSVPRNPLSASREPSSQLAPNPALDGRSSTPQQGRAAKAEHAGAFRSHSPSVAQLSRSERASPFAPSDLTAVVFEFVAGSSDRFLFPKYSILDMSADRTQVTASFLVVRSGSESKADEYEPKRRYHELVTVQLKTSTPKVLDALTRVVANPVDTNKHMLEIMDTTTRAKQEHLALQLPRDPEAKDERQNTTKRQERKPEATGWNVWTPPGSLRPLVS